MSVKLQILRIASISRSENSSYQNLEEASEWTTTRQFNFEASPSEVFFIALATLY